MPEFLAVQCYFCNKYQVQQKNKQHKFACAVCGAKQSVRKVFAISNRAADIRRQVQALNEQLGQQELQQEAQLAALDAGPQSPSEAVVNHAGPVAAACGTQVANAWQAFLDTKQASNSLGSSISRQPLRMMQNKHSSLDAEHGGDDEGYCTELPASKRHCGNRAHGKRLRKAQKDHLAEPRPLTPKVHLNGLQQHSRNDHGSPATMPSQQLPCTLQLNLHSKHALLLPDSKTGRPLARRNLLRHNTAQPLQHSTAQPVPLCAALPNTALLHPAVSSMVLENEAADDWKTSLMRGRNSPAAGHTECRSYRHNWRTVEAMPMERTWTNPLPCAQPGAPAGLAQHNTICTALQNKTGGVAIYRGQNNASGGQCQSAQIMGSARMSGCVPNDEPPSVPIVADVRGAWGACLVAEGENNTPSKLHNASLAWAEFLDHEEQNHSPSMQNATSAWAAGAQEQAIHGAVSTEWHM